MTSNNLLLYRLAELMLEHEQHILLVDLLFDDDQIGDFVKSIQIDSPYQQMLFEGVLTESVREEKLYVSFTVEGYFHYVLGEVINNQTNGKGSECLKQIVEENKLNGAKEGVEQCLIRDVLVDDLTRLMWLIDEGNDLLDIYILPLLYSLNSQGVKITIAKILENPTEKDWEALLKLDKQLEVLQLHILRKEFLTEVMPKNELNTEESITLGLKAINIFDKVEAINYLAKVNTKAYIILQDADLLSLIGKCEKKYANYNKALEYFEKSLEIRLKKFGSMHLSVASSFFNIAGLWNSKGDYNKSLDFYNKSLDINLNLLGSDHPDLATLYNNIAGLWNSKGDYNKSLDFYNKSLEIRLKTLGSVDISLATTYNNIGLSYEKNGQFENALDFYNKSLNIKLKTQGFDHLSVAISYNNLGLISVKIGKYNKALEYFEKSLDIKSKTLGIDHIDLATSYNNIGALWYNKEEYDKALYFYQKCLKITLKILGNLHSNVATSYNNIAGVWNKKGEFEKALENYDKSINIRLIALGSEHPDVASSYNNIGSLYINLNEFNKAIDNFQKGFKILHKGGFPFKIAQCYEALQEPIKALEYYMQSAVIRNEDLGLENKATQESIINAKRLAKELGKENELPDWMK